MNGSLEKWEKLRRHHWKRLAFCNLWEEHYDKQGIVYADYASLRWGYALVVLWRIIRKSWNCMTWRYWRSLKTKLFFFHSKLSSFYQYTYYRRPVNDHEIWNCRICETEDIYKIFTSAYRKKIIDQKFIYRMKTVSKLI